MTARILSNARRAGSGTRARYSSTLLGGTLDFAAGRPRRVIALGLAVAGRRAEGALLLATAPSPRARRPQPVALPRPGLGLSPVGGGPPRSPGFLPRASTNTSPASPSPPGAHSKGCAPSSVPSSRPTPPRLSATECQ